VKIESFYYDLSQLDKLLSRLFLKKKEEQAAASHRSLLWSRSENKEAVLETKLARRDKQIALLEGRLTAYDEMVKYLSTEVSAAGSSQHKSFQCGSYTFPDHRNQNFRVIAVLGGRKSSRGAAGRSKCWGIVYSCGWEQLCYLVASALSRTHSWATAMVLWK
jgi:hypothetical protein